MGWRFAFNRRWFGYLIAAIGFAVACVLLSQWQFARAENASLANERVTANYDADPVPLTQAVPDLDGFDKNDEWQRVEVSGRYLEDERLLVRNRPYNGAAGFELLVPFLTEDGTVFVVDRGWLPGGQKDLPDVIPASPTGEVTIVAHLKAGEPELPGRSAPAGQLATIQLDAVAELMDEPTYVGAYGHIVSESPSVADMPEPALKPSENEGMHLSYALQWIVFAFFGFGGLAWALRQEYRLVNADDPKERERAAIRREKAARRPTDADIEDELLDSARR